MPSRCCLIKKKMAALCPSLAHERGTRPAALSAADGVERVRAPPGSGKSRGYNGSSSARAGVQTASARLWWSVLSWCHPPLVCKSHLGTVLTLNNYWLKGNKWKEKGKKRGGFFIRLIFYPLPDLYFSSWTSWSSFAGLIIHINSVLLLTASCRNSVI